MDARVRERWSRDRQADSCT